MNKLLRNQTGSTLLTILSLVAVIGILGYLVVDHYVYATKRTLTEEVLAEGEALSQDLLDTAKYMILYEPIFFLDHPLNHSGSRGAQWKKLVAMGWGTVSTETMDQAKACGGYDGKGRQVGAYVVEGSRVFCPAYLRSPLFNNNMLEQMVLDPMAAKGIARRPANGQAGVYDLDMIFFDSDKSIDDLTPTRQGLFDLNVGQKLLRLKQKIDKAQVTIRILTSSAGFEGVGSERMLELTSLVQLKDTLLPYQIKAKQEFLIHPSTPKDFALFMMYPERADGTRTNSFRESVILPPGSEIEGRVFFNGNLDVPLDQLPVFHEIVIITGDFVPALTPATKAKLRTKFKKGILTRYSAARYIHTGNCSTSDPQAVFVNNSQLPCKTETGGLYGMNEYLDKFSTTCLNQDMVYENGDYKPRNGYTGTGSPKTCSGSGLIKGAYAKLEVLGTYALIASPIKSLQISASVQNIYGTVFGGHIAAKSPLNIKSFTHVSWSEIRGRPGIGGNEATFDALNTAFQSSYEGITAILSNLPIVYTGEAQ